MTTSITGLALGLVLTATSTSAFAQSVGSETADQTTPEAPSKEKAEHLRLGVLGGVGFPRPFSIEAMMKVERVFGLGLEYGFLPSTNIAGVDVRYQSLAVDARVFPFAGPFFVGARVGRQHVDASTFVTLASYGTFYGDASVDTWFINPRLGLLWTLDFGLTIGADVGLQIPVSKSSSTNLPPLPTGVSIPNGVTGIADTIGGSVLPTVTLLQLGMMF